MGNTSVSIIAVLWCGFFLVGLNAQLDVHRAGLPSLDEVFQVLHGVQTTQVGAQWVCPFFKKSRPTCQVCSLPPPPTLHPGGTSCPPTDARATRHTSFAVIRLDGDMFQSVYESFESVGRGLPFPVTAFGSNTCKSPCGSPRDTRPHLVIWPFQFTGQQKHIGPTSSQDPSQPSLLSHLPANPCQPSFLRSRRWRDAKGPHPE